jgi:3-dehydroquinate synthase
VTTIEIPIATARPYRVHVGREALGRLAAETADASRCAVLTDETVERLHASRLAPILRASRLAVAAGETSKSLATLERVLDFLSASDLDRQSVLVAFGGGVVGDLGGLAASLYMRGIDVVQCPTTLLAQVDSSFGGKTAVNLRSGKNLAGTFHQPRAVLCDTSLLSTLPDEELASGLGEAVKTALIGDAALLELLEREAAACLARDPAALAQVVERCVRVKGAIVARDEREGGERRALNLGHTFAHAIESAAGYGAVPHGVAVAAGLGLALWASDELGVLVERNLRERVAALLARLGLPADLAALRARYRLALEPQALGAGLRHDKKGRAGEPALVLVRRIGELALDQRAPAQLLAQLLA